MDNWFLVCAQQISTNNGPNKIEQMDPVCHSVRRVPIFRSVSTTPDVQFHRESPFVTSPIPNSNESNNPLDRLDSFEPFGQLINHRIPLRMNKRTPIDHHSLSSGYDSNNSSSSLSYMSTPSTIRRIPSLTNFSSYSSPFGTTDNNNNNSNNSQREYMRSKRYSYSEKCIKDELIRSIDRLEKRVSFFREVASELLQEKDKLLEALSQFDHYPLSAFTEADRQDIQANASCLRNRLEQVNISIQTKRSSSQLEALKKANECIDNLSKILHKDGKMAAKQRCLSYISSCSSDNLTDEENKQIPIPIDERFQRMVIQCSLDDQKSIRKKLESVLLSIEN
ncbi:BAG molecular chaperone regulator 2 [Blomia tropicalis]|nr:BAG molecular chaperone regulator 2 [Blomia tropicalis]